MGKIEIYGVIASPGVRAIILVAKAIGVPYELKECDPMKKPPELKKLNPQQQIPVMVDDGLVLPESRAIMKYLMDKHAKDDSLYPKDVKTRAIINARLDFDCGTLWPRLITAYRPAFLSGKNVTEEDLKPVHEAVQIVEEFLTRDKWIAGSKMTIADISFSSVLTGLSAFGFDLSQYSKILKWLAECERNIPHYNSINDEGIASLKERVAKLKNMGKP